MRLALITALLLAAGSAAAQTPAREFSVASSDGVGIHGQADAPDQARRGVVIFVAGTGAYDRDARHGNSGTERDLIFADLAARVTARGLSAVRYDRRGIRYGETGANRLDAALAGGATNETQRDDLAAIYDWTRARGGLAARCVVFVGHSEGMAHIGRLAASGARRPALVIGIGALLESPRAAFHWQRTMRDAHSLRLMDADGDGVTSNEEVRANWQRTPLAVWGVVEPFLSPSGAWDAAMLAQMPATQEQMIYVPERAAILAQPDHAPFPNAESAMASYAWIKSFFTDDTPIAQHLTRWRSPMIFYYGTYDSQTNFERQREAGAVLGNRATFAVQPGGHALGEHAFLGPIPEPAADRIADDAAAACGG